MSKEKENGAGELQGDILDGGAMHRLSVKDAKDNEEVSPQDQVDGPPRPRLETIISKRYNMSHEKRGQFIIINNEIFDPRTQLANRKGTSKDTKQLEMAFSKLGFEVHRYYNLTTTDMLRVLLKASKEDHSEADCFGCAILSHGSEGEVYGTDGVISIDTLLDEFKGDKSSSLANKPKLFFIQACRGTKLDEGVDVTDSAPADDEEQTYRIPSEANFLTCYSVVPGYFAWRNKFFGSCYIRALARVLMEDGEDNEIITMMTRVNRVVAYEFESVTSDEELDKKKQVPCIVSTLTKELYFRAKPQTYPGKGDIIHHDNEETESTTATCGSGETEATSSPVLAANPAN